MKQQVRFYSIIDFLGLAQHVFLAPDFRFLNIFAFCRFLLRFSTLLYHSGLPVVPHVQLSLLGHVLSLTKDTAESSRLSQVLVAAPQNIAKLVVRKL